MSNKYRISRRGKKLQPCDDQRVLAALPKDVPEKSWMEILMKEEIELMLFEIREDIVDEALKICYAKYMEKQNARFTAHCASQAWLKLIDWYFYRHDPGEEPSSYPPCNIPKRIESWTPDERPEPSPKDSWARTDLDVTEEITEQTMKEWPSTPSLDYPVIADIPQIYWFPGKVRVAGSPTDEQLGTTYSYYSETSEKTTKLAAESEVLQKVTDYSTEDLLSKESKASALRPSTPVDASLGAGDATTDRFKKRKHRDRSTLLRKQSVPASRSKVILPPLDLESKSKISIISDCRLRNPRLDTHYELSSEKFDTPPWQPNKRK